MQIVWLMSLLLGCFSNSSAGGSTHIPQPCNCTNSSLKTAFFPKNLSLEKGSPSDDSSPFLYTPEERKKNWRQRPQKAPEDDIKDAKVTLTVITSESSSKDPLSLWNARKKYNRQLKENTLSPLSFPKTINPLSPRKTDSVSRKIKIL